MNSLCNNAENEATKLRDHYWNKTVIVSREFRNKKISEEELNQKQSEIFLEEISKSDSLNNYFKYEFIKNYQIKALMFNEQLLKRVSKQHLKNLEKIYKNWHIINITTVQEILNLQFQLKYLIEGLPRHNLPYN